MSDTIKDLEKRYEDNVFNVQHPRSIGLFPIPEYPEFEAGRGMWSEALETILTTLRYLAPATLLTLFWGQQSFLFRLLKSIDSAFRAIVFSSEEQKQAALQWLAEAGTVRVEHLDTVWRHGWILCGVLDAALPGACAGHPPTRLSLKHAQAIADHYLGVEPVFSRQELESNDALSKHQEWKLATYIDRIRQALAKLTPPVSKPTSQRTSPETTEFTMDYVARGSGLTAAQVHNKMYFKIYPTSQQSLDPGEITILIRGPKDTYGMAVLPPILGKAQLIRQKLLGLQSKPNYTESAVPITQGASYLRSYGKNDMNKTYYIPKSDYDIEIEEDIREDHIKIGYSVAFEGKHEVSITSRGQNIVGSPFRATASNNIIGILERESFCLEDGEEIDIVDVETDRKVVLRIVDFVTEKMLLKENGVLEKISDDEAKILMSTDKSSKGSLDLDYQIHGASSIITNDAKLTKFKTAVRNLIKMNRVCQVLQDLIANKKSTSVKMEKTYVRPRSHQQDIPDIVNSTFSESNQIPFVLAEKPDKFIIPKSISVSLRTEKSKPLYKDETKNSLVDMDNSELSTPAHSNSPDSLENYETLEQQIEQDLMENRVKSPSNPFFTDIVQENFVIEKDLGSFVKTEYETNNSQNEETEHTSIKIMVEEAETPSPTNTNPFIEPDIINLERPKTPVLKIITGDIKNREDSIYVNQRSLTPDEMLANEFINPFYIHHHPPIQHLETLPIVDFIIGAPVSLPPIIRTATPEDSMLITNNNENKAVIRINEHKKTLDSVCDELPQSVFSTPIHTNMSIPNPPVTSTFHSLGSNASDNVEILSLSNSSDSQEIEALPSERNLTPRKDMWDSAYVSIDDSNSTPDSNNNDNLPLCETPSKQKFYPSGNSNEFSNMGPAEREIWQTCNDLKHDTSKVNEDVKFNKWEVKRPTFTPIMEENDRCILGMKDLRNSDTHSKEAKIDPVTVVSNMGPAEREIWQTCNDLKHDTPKVNEDVKSNKWEVKRPTSTPIMEENDRSITGVKDLRNSDTHSKEAKIDPVTVSFAEINDLYHDYFPNPKNGSTTTMQEESKQFVEKDLEYTNERNDVSVHSASVASDVKRHAKKSEGKISEVQANVTESVSVSQNLPDNKIKDSQKIPKSSGETQFGDKTRTNIVSERKQYWDEKIREIEAKSEENKTQQRRRRLSSKHLRHNDSLTKRRGKQIVKKFLSAGEQHQNTTTRPSEIKSIEILSAKSPMSAVSLENQQIDIKLVKKWKNFWDSELEIENDEPETTCFRAKSPKSKESSISSQQLKQSKENTIEVYEESKDYKGKSSIPVKQELPEEVFKAFETSPKRFFGTSRKQILNKIDTFLGKPSTADESSTDVSGAIPDTGLVSSRISLFHNISQADEQLPCTQRKCQSMHNIFQRKNSEKSNDLVDDKIIRKTMSVTKEENIIQNNFDTTNIKEIDNNVEIVKTKKDFEKQEPNILLKDKRAKLAQKTYNKTFDESVYKRPMQEQKVQTELPNVKNVVKQYNKHSQHIQKYQQKSVLRKSAISKSEMDIFNKFANKPCDDNLDKHKSCDELPKINVKNFISLYEKVSKTDVKAKLTRKTSKTNCTSFQRPAEISSSSGAVNTTYHTTTEEMVRSKNITTYSQPSSLRQSIKYQWSNKSLDTVSNNSFGPRSIDSIDIDIVSIPDAKETTHLSLSDIEFEIVENQEKFTKPLSPETVEKSTDTDYKSRYKLAKQFFQSLEELRDDKKPRKLNECELLLVNESTESLENERPQKRVKRNIKAHSMPSSELSKIWTELQESQSSSNTKLVKISEKFNVDDLFNDVMEGRLSRQGSLRGIPHKKAVLEAFRSMENLTDNKISPYEMAVSQLNDFAKENQNKNAQEYLNEYPYLPTTDPSKYQSRMDTNATGLITLKELANQKPRRNSVPDLRMNAKFTVKL